MAPTGTNVSGSRQELTIDRLQGKQSRLTAYDAVNELLHKSCQSNHHIKQELQQRLSVTGCDANVGAD